MKNKDKRVLYAVTARLPNSRVADEYVDWLAGGHIQEVLAHGATRGAIVKMESLPDGQVFVESQYTFDSRTAFDTYDNNGADELRREGLRVFGPDRGVRFDRRIGQILHEFPGS